LLDGSLRQGKEMKNKTLTKEQVLSLFMASIENGFSLATVAIDNIPKKNNMHISLGLAELALEELGKSYTCLSYYCLTEQKEEIWADFWKDWKNHTVKAHRAFFYEFFSLFRIEIKDSGKLFPTIRESIPVEKEVSFYVDFDFKKNEIVQPFKAINTDELFYRVSSVVGPLNVAFKVKKMIEENKDEDYRMAVSNYALQTITSNMYQQDVEKVLRQMKNGISEYDRALNDIWNLFNPEKETSDICINPTQGINPIVD
jgi:AbiV family abortive infection protein